MEDISKPNRFTELIDDPLFDQLDTSIEKVNSEMLVHLE